MYIRELTLDEFYDHAFHTCKGWLVPAEPSEEEQQLIKTVLKELQSRVKLISEVVEMSRYFFTDDFPYMKRLFERSWAKGC